MAQAVADVPETGLASKPEDPTTASDIKEDSDGPSRESAVSAACLACVSGRSSFIYSSPTSLGNSMTAFAFFFAFVAPQQQLAAHSCRAPFRCSHV